MPHVYPIWDGFFTIPMGHFFRIGYDIVELPKIKEVIQ